MFTRSSLLSRAHFFFKQQLMYPLLLSSLLALAIFGGRVYLSRSALHLFLMWNLFLAWVPYLCSVWVAYLLLRERAHWWNFVVPSALWLLFFPNAAYLVTDFVNLDEKVGVPLWYDAVLFFVCAWTGLLLALVSLNTMQTLVKKFVGGAASWIFVFGIVGLTGVGLYLGRFLRWNSWDVVLHPYRILHDALTPVLHPLSHAQILGFTFMFAAFLLVTYLTFVSVQQRERT